MARIVLVRGAFNELWGPNELKARWLPALRDGLWHHDVALADDDVDVCFYGDLFRRAPGTETERRLEQSRAGIAESMSELAGGDAVAVLGQAAGPEVDRLGRRDAPDDAVDLAVAGAAAGGDVLQPSASIARTRSGRLRAPILRMMLQRWICTVTMLIPRSAAIFLLRNPRTTSRATSRSRGVSDVKRWRRPRPIRPCAIAA